MINDLPAAEALWSSSSKEACLPGTRTEMIASINESLTKSERRFTWVRGSPGTGKSAVAKTVSSDLETSGRLAASFFFDKRAGEGNSDAGTTKSFVTTIARQLARFNSGYRKELGKALEQDSMIPKKQLLQQLRLLIVQPMQRVDFTKTNHTIVIALDALDECGDRKALDELASLLVELDALPPIFKIFFTCRPQPAILQWFENGDSAVKAHTIVENLDLVSKESTNADLRRFVTVEIEKMKDFHSDEAWPPKPKEITKFAQRCEGLFEIAALRLRRLAGGPDIGNTYASVFATILEETDETSPSYEAGLDAEYYRILESTYPSGPAYRAKDVEKALQKYREVVGALVTVKYAMDIETLAALIGMEKSEVRAVFRPLSAIIYFPTNEDEPVYPYHASFQEFLLKIPQDPTPRQLQFLFDGPQDRLLAHCCLERMAAELRQDMCHYDADKIPLMAKVNVNQRKRWDFITDHTYYAVLYWADHLVHRDDEGRLQRETETFMTQSLIFWFETLAYVDCLTEGGLMLHHYESWYKVRLRFLLVQSASTRFEHESCL